VNTVFWGVIGLILGSFFNVVILRVPRGESIVHPSSHCPFCRRELKPIELIPIVSFIMQSGRCRSCGSRISIQYPIVEFVTGLGFALINLWSDGFGQLLAGLTFFSFLLICTVIDLNEMILPNKLTVPGMIIGLIFAAVGFTIPFWQSLLGLFVGGAILLVISLISRGGMGLGDVKFIAFIGSFVGVLGVLKTLFIASIIGTVIGLIYLLYTKQGRTTPIPFGPFLAVAGAIVFFIL
jgi:prepilin signal peptidase PulO-like enzyme (type II secretory pathway)